MHTNAVSRFALSSVLALSLAAPAVAKTPKDHPAVVASQAAGLPAKIHIFNFGKVSDTYFRGAQPKGQDFADLSALGVKLVIDLAREGDVNEGPNAERAGMKFVRIPLTTGTAPTQAQIDQFLKLVNDPKNQPVYVHCIEGRHRTGAMTATYRMTNGGWTADQAFAEMKQYKFGADFLHPALKSFVYSFYSGIEKSGPPVLLATSTPVVP